MKCSCRSSFTLRPTLLACALIAGSFILPAAGQTELYFDQNGAATNFGIVPEVVYDWNTSDAVWNVAWQGTGALSAWNNSGNSVAAFALLSEEYINPTAYLSSRVRLTEAITINQGLSVGIRGWWNSLILQADSPQTITFSPGSTINLDAQAYYNGVVFGNNVRVEGDLKITGGTGSVQITGTGPAYDGTITIATNTAFGGFLYATHPTPGEAAANLADTAKFVIDSGSLLTNTNPNYAPDIVIGELSGAGGYIRPVAYTSLIVSQNSDTIWGGQIGDGPSVAAIGFTKQGSGILSLTTSGTHYIRYGLAVKDTGKLYVRGDIVDPSPGINYNITIDGGATFGGTSTTNKIVILNAASSILAPGMEGEAGVMTLGSGIIGSDGGTFNFDLGGEDDSGDLLNSRIVITGGTVIFGGTKTVNLYDLGLKSLALNVNYVLFDASAGGVSLTDGWDQGWVIGVNEFEWLGIAALGFEDNQLFVSFNAIPEPSTGVLLGSTLLAGWLLYGRKRNGSRALSNP